MIGTAESGKEKYFEKWGKKKIWAWAGKPRIHGGVFREPRNQMFSKPSFCIV